jgi:hypothetical protein
MTLRTRARIEPSPDFDDRGDDGVAGTDEGEVLEDTEVLQQLERGIAADREGDPIAGIRNGVLIGSALWLLLIMGLRLALG